MFRAIDGRWQCFLELPPHHDGKRRRRKISANTKAAAIQRRKAAERELEDGTPDRITVGVAVEEWLSGREGVVQRDTIDNYRNVTKRHRSVVTTLAWRSHDVRDWGRKRERECAGGGVSLR